VTDYKRLNPQFFWWFSHDFHIYMYIQTLFDIINPHNHLFDTYNHLTYFPPIFHLFPIIARRTFSFSFHNLHIFEMRRRAMRRASNSRRRSDLCRYQPPWRCGFPAHPAVAFFPAPSFFGDELMGFLKWCFWRCKWINPQWNYHLLIFLEISFW